MKKTLFTLLTIALCLSLVGMASGAEANLIGTQELSKSGQSSDLVQVSYSITAEKYTVTIPDSFNFYDLEADTVNTKVNATNVVLTKGCTLNVSVVSEYNWIMKEYDSDGNVVTTPDAGSIPYTMYYKMPSANGYEQPYTKELSILRVAKGTAETLLRFTMDEDAPHLGTYHDTLTFKAEIDRPVGVTGAD